ncbi:DinB family protein [Peribacillus sp. NPDC097295]|uniref:DinB family protein n=1 Tax=Peribacillus sp. NPDC097295 TaxID=3364402 RepID=UPI0037F5FFB8
MNILEMNLLFETRNQLIDEISGLNSQTINSKPISGGWSIAQICHHLFLSENVFTEAIVSGLKDRDYKRIIQKNIYLTSDPTKKFKAPKITLPSQDTLNPTVLLDKLFESRYLLLNVIFEQEDRTVFLRKKAKHPLFGYLSLEQWVELLSLHEKRHIEQIKDVKLHLM